MRLYALASLTLISAPELSRARFCIDDATATTLYRRLRLVATCSRVWFLGVVICGLVLGCGAVTTISHLGGRTSTKEITSRHGIDRQSLLPARRAA